MKSFRLFIAFRYLFSPKSFTAVNVISAISIAGIVIVTAAIICVLSVYNGFENLMTSSSGNFNPDLKITALKGKVFSVEPSSISEISKIDGVSSHYESIEGNGLLIYDKRQFSCSICGVSKNFEKCVNLPNIIVDGTFSLTSDSISTGNIGTVMAVESDIRPGDHVDLYVPKRDAKPNLVNPISSFKNQPIFITSVFNVNDEKIDAGTLIVPLASARILLGYSENTFSSLSFKLDKNADVKKIREEIRRILGNNVLIQNQKEQQIEVYNMFMIEKWISFFILVFIFLIAAFNVVGMLSMLIIEKKDSVSILRAMGCNRKDVARIFMLEGYMVVLAGIVGGIILGVSLCLLQQHFGLIRLENSNNAFLTDYYPVQVKLSDIIYTFLSVLLLCCVVIILPSVKLLKRIDLSFNKK